MVPGALVAIAFVRGSDHRNFDAAQRGHFTVRWVEIGWNHVPSTRHITSEKKIMLTFHGSRDYTCTKCVCP